MNRFKIEDIEVQDSSGIVFRATDTETGLPVSVRRFFPFGPNGGGLNEAEQADYEIAVQRFAEIRHPALRAIISGGCDPVDGMPYLATEWIEGSLLDTCLEHRPLSEAEATVLINHALDACEALSQVIGYDGVWIETDANSIVIGADGAKRPFTFWMSPLKWLGRTSGQRGMEPLISLTESIMRWEGKPAGSLPTQGVGGWLKWLHGAVPAAGIHEARERLGKPNIPVHSPVAAMPPLRQATRAVVPAKTTAKARSKAPARILASTVLVALGLAGWLVVQRNAALTAEASAPLKIPVVIRTDDALPKKSPSVKPDAMDDPVVTAPAVISSSSGDRSPEQATRRLAELSANAKTETRELDERRLRIQERGFFTLDDGELLLEKKGVEVKLQGRVANVRASNSGKTTYLEFSNPYVKDEPLGYVMTNKLTSNMNEDSLRKLIGRTVRIQGKVRTFGKRPEIRIKGSASIEELP